MVDRTHQILLRRHHGLFIGFDLRLSPLAALLGRAGPELHELHLILVGLVHLSILD